MEITIDGANKVTIRASRMNLALRQRVNSDVWKTAPGDDPGGFDFSRYNIALWRHNILKVEGPLFEGVAVPLTRIAIENLPVELDDLMNKALNEISRINAPDPNPKTPAKTEPEETETTTPTTDIG